MTYEDLAATSGMHAAYSTAERLGALLLQAGAKAQREWIGLALMAAGDPGLELAASAADCNEWRLWRHGNNTPHGEEPPRVAPPEPQEIAALLAPLAEPATASLLSRASSLEPTAAPEDGSIPLEPLSVEIVSEKIRLGLTGPFKAKSIIGTEIRWP